MKISEVEIWVKVGIALRTMVGFQLWTIWLRLG